jgi:6-phosphogluconolactonase
VSRLQVHSSAERLAEAAAARIAGLASAAVARRGRFVIALAGGSTPEPTYRRLARGGAGQRVPWSQFEIFWGDERCVRADHPDSNYRMAHRALLRHVPVPDGHVHRIQGELPPAHAAAAYEAQLQQVLAGTCFDLILLGLGADGHTASLFPDTSAVEERDRAVVAVYVDKLQAWRVTLTLPVINAARDVIFLVSGTEKAGALAQVRAGADVPAARVHPDSGRLTWLVDRDAAAELPRENIVG